MAKDGLQGSAKERLRESRRELDFLLEPLVIIHWPEIEEHLTKLLSEHNFGAEDVPNFTKVLHRVRLLSTFQ